MTINWDREKREPQHIPPASVAPLTNPVEAPSTSAPAMTPPNTTPLPDTHDEGCIWSVVRKTPPLMTCCIPKFQFLDIRSHEDSY